MTVKNDVTPGRFDCSGWLAKLKFMIRKIVWPFREDAAPIHIIEARERYWILRRVVEYHLDQAARDLKVNDWRLKEGRREEKFILQHIAEVDKKFRERCEKHPDNGVNRKGDRRRCAEEGFPRLLNYYKILLINESKLGSSRYEDLSLQLRDLNFIRTRLLSDKLIKDEMLLSQLDFCKIEATNLGMTNEPEIKVKLDQAAEELNASAGSGSVKSGGDNDKARRYLISLMATLNNYRVRRIYEQIYRRKKYMTLCFVLLFLSCIIFELTPNYLHGELSEHRQKLEQSSERGDVDVVAYGGSGAVASPVIWPIFSLQEIETEPYWLMPVRAMQNVFYSLLNLIASNQLYYIFFAGYAGGIFSMMMEYKPKSKLPGDEIYTTWYYRTRPVIGAFGAMVMYIIIVSPAFGQSVGAVLSDEIINQLRKDSLSATGFAFGFLTGFSERILLPKLNQTS